LPDDAQRTADLTEAFYCAIAFDHASASLWLIAKGAIDINDATTFDEGTVLGVAAGHNRPKVVEALLEKGCDPNTISPMGYTPLFELLIALPHPKPSPNYVLLYENALQTAKYLVDAGAKREIVRNGKKERAVDMAQGILKVWLHGLGEANIFDEVMNPGTPPKEPKTRGP
jgi:ankyrin repeat protein